MKITVKNCRKAVVLLIVGLAVASFILTTGCRKGIAEEKSARADIVTIDAMTVFGKLERPPVLFKHDLHTDALAKQDKDCSVCHLRMDDDDLSQKFFRLTDDDEDAVMAIYHDNCLNCHKETAASGNESGPVTCGECHRLEAKLISSWQPIGFDKSLHHRHIKATGDCGDCHHQYDKVTGKLLYFRGQENSCRDCHFDETTDDVQSLRSAAHRSCLGCHLEKEDAGPADCAGCHDIQRQMDIEKVENPKRLERNQPDFVLISAPESELASSKMNTVPFSHEGHERFNATCRVCHHESLNSCKNCHTLRGTEIGGGVGLQQAMHDMNSNHSCVGCHNFKKFESQCAGCHSMIEQGSLSEYSCEICHAGPAAENLAQAGTEYTSLTQFKPSPEKVKLSFDNKDIPENVTIGILADEYDPVVFPHRQIVQKLMAHIGESRIAVYFHGHEDVVCQGCHHNSPVGIKPPLCESCHGEPFNEADLFKPGLKGAYHQQCIGCHKEMKIKEVSDCSVCHKDKSK